MPTACWRALTRKLGSVMRPALPINASFMQPWGMGIPRWPRNIERLYQLSMKTDTKVLKLVRRPAALDNSPGVAVAELEEYHGLTREQLLRVYRTMYLSRRMDDKE